MLGSWILGGTKRMTEDNFMGHKRIQPKVYAGFPDHKIKGDDKSVNQLVNYQITFYSKLVVKGHCSHLNQDILSHPIRNFDHFLA